MVLWCMMFGNIISKVETPGCPIDIELFVQDSVLDPVETHVNSLGTFLFDSVIGNACGRGVVSLERGGWLGMPHFIESVSDGHGFSSIEKECPKFSFSR